MRLCVTVRNSEPTTCSLTCCWFLCSDLQRRRPCERWKEDYGPRENEIGSGACRDRIIRGHPISMGIRGAIRLDQPVLRVATLRDCTKFEPRRAFRRVMA